MFAFPKLCVFISMIRFLKYNPSGTGGTHARTGKKAVQSNRHQGKRKKNP